VSSVGTGFQVGGAAYPVRGTNIHYLGWASRLEVDDALGRAKAMGLNVVRTFIGLPAAIFRCIAPPVHSAACRVRPQ
jgi:hypothetical protein